MTAVHLVTSAGSQALQKGTNGAGHVLGAAEIPRTGITGEIAGVPVGVAQFGDGTNDVFYFRYTINAADDIQAAARLKNGYPNVYRLNPGDNLFHHADVDITRLDIVAIGDATSGTLSAGELVTRGETEANYLLAMRTWRFTEANTRGLLLQATDRYSATTAGAPAVTANYVDVFVEGQIDE